MNLSCLARGRGRALGSESRHYSQIKFPAFLLLETAAHSYKLLCWCIKESRLSTKDTGG